LNQSMRRGQTADAAADNGQAQRRVARIRHKVGSNW
jgi:hypothetical protein